MSVDMSKHFSTSALIKFTLPTIAMMIFTSCYTIKHLEITHISQEASGLYHILHGGACCLQNCCHIFAGLLRLLCDSVSRNFSCRWNNRYLA